MNGLQQWLQFYASGVVTLFAMMNPFAAVPVFLALTASASRREQRTIGWRAARNSAVVLLVCLVAGALAMQFFSISLAALRVAGGLIIAFLGFKLLFDYAEPGDVAPASAKTERLDPSLVPLAIPTLSGPGSMSVVITSSTTIPAGDIWSGRITVYLVESMVIVSVALLAWLVLRASPKLLRLMGADGIASLKGIMGFLLVCIGVQFVANGVADFVTTYVSG